MNELDQKLNVLGRMLTRFQLSANRGQPALVLAHNMRLIHKVAGELIPLLDEDPSATVHINPFLGPHQTKLLSAYFDGAPEVPDSPEDLT